MLLKNVAGQGVYLFAYDTVAAAPKVGDAGNITGKVSLDGAAQAATGTTHPTEIGSGLYWQPLAQGETDANAVGFAWSSTTAGVAIDPMTGFTARTVLDATGLNGVTIETGLNARQALAISSAALAGVIAGNGTTAVTVNGAGVSATRITATTDSNNNRTAVTLSPPP